MRYYHLENLVTLSKKMNGHHFFAPVTSGGTEPTNKPDPVLREVLATGASLSTRVEVSLTKKTDIKKMLRLSGELSAYLKFRRSIADRLPMDRVYHGLKNNLVKIDHLIAEKSEL